MMLSWSQGGEKGSSNGINPQGLRYNKQVVYVGDRQIVPQRRKERWDFGHTVIWYSEKSSHQEQGPSWNWKVYKSEIRHVYHYKNSRKRQHYRGESCGDWDEILPKILPNNGTMTCWHVSGLSTGTIGSKQMEGLVSKVANISPTDREPTPRFQVYWGISNQNATSLHIWLSSRYFGISNQLRLIPEFHIKVQYKGSTYMRWNNPQYIQELSLRLDEDPAVNHEPPAWSALLSGQFCYLWKDLQHES
jgi:hypothetical protein